MSVYCKVIGKNIKKFRKQKHFSQRKLANELNLSLSHISQIERGSKAASIDTYEHIANYFGVDVPALFTDPDKPKIRYTKVLHDINAILEDMEPKQLYIIRHLLEHYQTALSQYDDTPTSDLKDSEDNS